MSPPTPVGACPLRTHAGVGEAYRLFWPEGRTDFVRLAARFNATLVPFGAVGAADLVSFLADAEDVGRLTDSIRRVSSRAGVWGLGCSGLGG